MERRAFLVGAASAIATMSCRRNASLSSRGEPPSAPARITPLLGGQQITAARLDASGRWLATLSTGRDSGHVVTWDVEKATSLHVYADERVGFTWGEDCLAWAPGSRQLAATVSTSALVVIEEGRAVYTADLDVTQDHPTEACWIDDRRVAIRTDAGGAVVEVIPGVHLMSEGHGEPIVDTKRDSQRPVDPSTAYWMPGERTCPRDAAWNASIRALVGESFITGDPSQVLCGIDPKSGDTHYVTSLAPLLPKPKARRIFGSADGRRIAVAGFSGITLFDGDTGRALTRLPLLRDEPGIVSEHEKGSIDGMRWGAGNRLAVWARGQAHLPSRVMYVVGDRVRGSVDESCATLAWSPGGDAVALLAVDHSAIRIVEVATLRTRRIIATGIRSIGGPAELGWGAADHLMLVSPGGVVAFWTAEGKLVAHYELG